MLKQRVFTGSVLAAVFLALLFLAPPLVFTVFVTLVFAIAAWEWAGLCELTRFAHRVGYAVVVIACGIAVWYAVHREWMDLLSVLGLAGLWWAVALLWVQGYPSSSVLWRPAAIRLLMGVLVLLPALVAVYELQTRPAGAYLILAVVIIVAAADSGAYFVGKALGKHKLAPRVSPGKSWEGVFGGAALVAVLAVLYSVVTARVPIPLALAIALPASMVSVLGDLLESMLKRFSGVKDSSRLLPGHGGVLDRIDGLVASIPIFSLMLSLTL